MKLKAQEGKEEKVLTEFSSGACISSSLLGKPWGFKNWPLADGYRFPAKTGLPEAWNFHSNHTKHLDSVFMYALFAFPVLSSPGTLWFLFPLDCNGFLLFTPPATLCTQCSACHLPPFRLKPHRQPTRRTCLTADGKLKRGSEDVAQCRCKIKK